MLRRRPSRPPARRLAPFAWGLCCALGLTGCPRRAEIRSYRAPKNNAVDSLVELKPAPPADTPAFDVPEGWRPGQSGGMRRAAFRVEEAGREVEITVIDLPPAAGELLPNVNRWRQQVGLASIASEELEPIVRKIQVGDVEGSYVELIGPAAPGPRKAILAVMAIRGGKPWFFTLRGDAELAQREKQRFEAFVRSVRFGPADGEGDGHQDS